MEEHCKAGCQPCLSLLTNLVLYTAFLLISCKQKKAAPIFSLQPASSTGINFINKVEDSKDFNIFRYRNFYNGGGVAVGDINNDGKADIFFTANQQSNRLYLNKGNWKFEDITDKAGVPGIHKWHTGASMVDINADGWLDIYVCNSGDINGDDRANELYINQKNGTFREAAAEYGLDDKGLGTQAVFFDYDMDGDLDCFILNNSYRAIESFGYNRMLRHKRDDKGGDRLLRNDNGHFNDVSTAANIFGSEIGFGLGVTVGDINNDGWPDIYVSNDFFEKDYLYINQRDGTFTETSDAAIGHMSESSMGSDMMDINNDGNLDIFTTDMLPETDYRLKTTTKFNSFDILNARLENDFHHQFISNCLQLNNGDGTFSEIAGLAGVEATDWSWGALGFDFDNDGWKDLFVSNGIGKDLTNQDFLEYFTSDQEKNRVFSSGFDFQHALSKMPSTPIVSYGFLNQKNLRFKNDASVTGIETPAFSNGASYGDLDNDGDLDLIVNNENMPAFIYRNMTSEKKQASWLKVVLNGEAPNTLGYGARVTVYYDSMQQVIEQMPSRGFQSSVEPVLNFGIGSAKIIDSISVRWPDLKQQTLTNISIDTTIRLQQAEAIQKSVYASPVVNSLFERYTSEALPNNKVSVENKFIDFDTEKLVPKMLSTEGPKLSVADINGDGLDDFFMGSVAGDTSCFFIQQPGGRFLKTLPECFIRDKDTEDAGSCFADIDGDGDIDLIVSAGGNQHPPGSLELLIRLYINDGKGNFSRRLKGIPPIGINASAVISGDIDGNGAVDFFIAGRSVAGNYGLDPGSALLLNDGKGNFRDMTAALAPSLKNSGMVTSAVFCDIDNDSRQELILAGDWMPLTIYGFRNGKLEKEKELDGSSGWWNSLLAKDINGDGYADLIAGNQGLNSKIRADRDQPARMFVADFDKNGSSDCIAAYYKSDGKSYPFNLRRDLMAQIPSFNKKFLRYDSYAGKTLEEVLTAEQLAASKKLMVQQTQTCVFYNDGKGNFSMEPLPVMAQVAPVFTIQADDFNNDGITDIFLAGNFYGLKPETGRYDASYGITLLGSRGKGFQYCNPSASGLFVRGEVRDVKKIMAGNNYCLIVSRNNASPEIFRKR